jgi:hypothetical protein
MVPVPQELRLMTGNSRTQYRFFGVRVWVVQLQTGSKLTGGNLRDNRG